MANGLWRSVALIPLVLVLAACSGGTLARRQAVDAAWDTLAPNTSSGDRANWQVTVAEKVKGRDVADEFEGEASLGCWQGPTPVPNGEVKAGADYWYVEMRPKAATPLPGPTLSPTAPPFIPEPFLRQTLFLIDMDGNIVARKLFCVVY